MTKLARQLHRWIGIAFVLGFIFNTVVIFSAAGKQPDFWVYLFALIPLFLLLATGVWMLGVHYGKKMAQRPTAAEAA
jgi:cytochrome b subunit of formate dehydrogenase